MDVMQLEILVYALFGVAVFSIAYVLKKYGELSDQIIDEKLLAFDFVIPALEQIIPYLPDKYKEEATFILDLLKDMKTINEAIKNVPATARLKAWRSYRKTLEAKYKLKQRLLAR